MGLRPPICFEDACLFDGRAVSWIESRCGWEGCHRDPLSHWLTWLHFPLQFTLRSCLTVHLLYLDDAGPAGNQSEEYLALDSVSVFEAQSPGTTLQQMSVGFRTLGTSWGVIRNLADTPFFVDSRASRVIQLADHVAYAVFRRYQAGDTQYLDRIASKFHSVDGVVHGLAHKEPGKPDCMCIACLSRRSGGTPAE